MLGKSCSYIYDIDFKFYFCINYYYVRACTHNYYFLYTDDNDVVLYKTFE